MDQALRDQRLQPIQIGAGHLLGRLQRPPAGKHRQVRKQLLLAHVEQVVLQAIVASSVR